MRSGGREKHAAPTTHNSHYAKCHLFCMAPNLSELVSGYAYNSDKGATRFFKWGVPQTPENNTKVLLKVRGLTQFLNGAPAPNPGVISSALSLPSLFKGSGSCPQAVCGTHDPFVSTTSPAHLKPLNRRWVSGCYSKAHHHAQRPFLP